MTWREKSPLVHRSVCGHRDASVENFTWVFVLMQVREIQKLKGCEAGGIKRRVGVIRPAGEEGLASWTLVSGQAPARFWNCQLCLPSDGRLPKEGQAGGLFKSTRGGGRNPSPPTPRHLLSPLVLPVAEYKAGREWGNCLIIDSRVTDQSCRVCLSTVVKWKDQVMGQRKY